MAIFWTGDLFFVYINFRKINHFLYPPATTPFVWFRCKFIFVQLWRVFCEQNEQQSPNRNNYSRKFPRGMAILWTDDLFFVYIKYRKIHNFLYPTATTPFVWFRCKIIFVQLWRVFCEQNEQQSPNRNNYSRKFPRGMAIVWTGDLFFVYIKYRKIHHFL
jgi:hypothetical protein